VASTRFDFERFRRDSASDLKPRHLLPEIAERLDAELHQPAAAGADGVALRLSDRLGPLLYGQSSHWELARRVHNRLNDGDAVYCSGCDVGLPLALRCGLTRRQVELSVVFADVGRTRTRVLCWLLVLLGVRLTALVTTEQQAAAVNRSFGRRFDNVVVIEGQTDTRFFRPRPHRNSSEDDGPALIGACGVERRDYETLASAVADIEASTVVCFASPNLTDRTRYTMPDPVPDNMSFEHLDFAELRRLYQRADVVVLPLLENRYSAGLTALFEAMACGAPVVVTDSPGIIERLIAAELVVGVPAGRPDLLRQAIEDVLADPGSAAERAGKARAEVTSRYSADRFLDSLIDLLSGRSETFDQPRS
jgi:hypothetical protein